MRGRVGRGRIPACGSRPPIGARATAAAVVAVMAVCLPGVVVPAAVAAEAGEPPGTAAMISGLAHESLQGRGLGTEGLAEAGRLVRDWLRHAGAAPGLDDGAWFQEFDAPGGGTIANVVGRIAGSGDEWVVIGAHYDGLGLGEPGSEYAGQVHFGADDNASGVAALVRIAAVVAAVPELERSVYLVAFTGEEAGTLGSRHFVDHPPRDAGQLVAMLNLDTIGGLENDQLIVFGTGTAEEFPSILRGVNHVFRLDLAMNSEGAGASDHVPFFSRGIPVLHFFTGAKPGYHRPGDRVDLVNVAGVERVAGFVGELALYLASEAEPLTFRPVGAERLDTPSRPAKRRRTSFGSIPDFSRESGGILLTGVMPGSGAQAAGLEAGDVIIRIGDTEIDNIYDFQGVLSSHEPGDTVAVRFVRGEETRDTNVVLAERR